MTNNDKPSKRTRAHGAVEGFPRLLGGRLCFDYVNTLEKWLKDGPADFLPTFTDLARWAQHVRLASEQDVQVALVWEQGHREAATDLYARAMELRAALTRIFTAITHEDEPNAQDLRILEKAFLQPSPVLKLQSEAERFEWSWSEQGGLVERLLWQIADSAVRTLTLDDLDRIKECPGADDCGSIFYDSSRNGTRRWCSMEGCGSRVKMRRHYAQHVRSDT